MNTYICPDYNHYFISVILIETIAEKIGYGPTAGLALALE